MNEATRLNHSPQLFADIDQVSVDLAVRWNKTDGCEGPGVTDPLTVDVAIWKLHEEDASTYRTTLREMLFEEFGGMYALHKYNGCVYFANPTPIGALAG